MANVVTDPKEHPEAVIPDFTKPDPLLTFKLDDVAFVYGSKWKQRYFTKVGDDYFPLAGAVGRHAPAVAPVLRAAEHRLVGAALSGRQHEAADRPAVRRLPLGELRRRRRRRSPNGTSAARSATARAASTSRDPARANIVNPARLDYVQRQRHLHPVPLAGPAADESDRGQYYDWPVGFQSGLEPEGLLEARGAQARRDDVHALSPTARRTRTGCRATTSCRA